MLNAKKTSESPLTPETNAAFEAALKAALSDFFRGIARAATNVMPGTRHSLNVGGQERFRFFSTAFENKFSLRCIRSGQCFGIERSLAIPIKAHFSGCAEGFPRIELAPRKDPDG